MSFTLKEFTAAVSDWEDEAMLDDELFMSIWYGAIDSLPTIEGIGKLEFADQWGGEGDGAQIHVVLKVGDRYFQRDGYFSSWGEDSMDGAVYEVKPKQVMKTEYEAI